MEHHQKNFYISALVVVGLAIIIGLQKSKNSEAEANFKALNIDLMEVAARAQQYYCTSKCLNGGGHTFYGLSADKAGLKKLFTRPCNENGCFEIIKPGDRDSLLLRGIGHCDYDNDHRKLTIQMTVYPDCTKTEVLSY